MKNLICALILLGSVGCNSVTNVPVTNAREAAGRNSNGSLVFQDTDRYEVTLTAKTHSNVTHTTLQEFDAQVTDNVTHQTETYTFSTAKGMQQVSDEQSKFNLVSQSGNEQAAGILNWTSHTKTSVNYGLKSDGTYGLITSTNTATHFYGSMTLAKKGVPFVKIDYDLTY